MQVHIYPTIKNNHESLSLMIRAENIIFEYPGKRALDNVSFDIKAGGVTALVGPNGAGKTTLMRSIAALDDPFSGHIYVDGIDTQADPRKVHRHIGYLSDFFGLYEDLTVRQSLSYFARAHLIQENEIKNKVDLAIERLNLRQYVNSRASELSRGWRQRLGIAQSIIHEPKLLLLDEPASGLDPEARQSLSELFLALKDQGMTLLVSSHILAELEDYCTDMLLLRDGKIISHDASTASNIDNAKLIVISFTSPATPYVRQVEAVQYVVEARANGNEIHCTFKGTDEEQHQLLSILIKNNMPVTSFAVQEKSLQDIYMDIARQGGARNAN